MSVCRNCGTQNPEGFRFCGACGTALDVEAPAPREERKIVTILFTDIVGSTARAESLDPEDVRALLATYYERLRYELERFGGTVEKFIGDAVVAVFGAPIAHEDDPERAVRAGLAIKDAIDEMNAADEWLDLHIRIGINTGEALVVLNARTTEEGLVSGDVINTAARLQSNAPVDGILVGELTYRSTLKTIEYEAGAPVSAKGKSKPLDVWEARGLKILSHETVGRHRLIGRDQEIERLREIWGTVTTESSPRIVTTLGAPGVGKSRLLTEFTNSLGEERTFLRGRCLSYGEGITYWPVIDMLKSAAQILQTDAPQTMSEKLDAWFGSLTIDDEDEFRTVSSAVANLVGIQTGSSGLEDAGQITQTELHWGIKRLFRILSVRSPLVLLIEDLHWAEPTLLDLIRYVGQPASAMPVLILTTARPELFDEQSAHWAPSTNHDVIELSSLAHDESRALLAELYGAELPDSAVEALLEAAGGNPLFLEETVGMLTTEDSGEVGGSRFVQERIAIGVPTNLVSLIGARLDQLPTEDKAVSQRAAVAGTVFWEGAIEYLNGIGSELAECLLRLERRDFIHARSSSSVADEREFAFKHNLIRDVAYQQLPKGLRTKLHVRFADWVSTLSGPHDEFVEIVAYHLEQSCRLAREVARAPVPPPIVQAVRALISAAEKAERREGLREADRFYERALEILGEQHTEIAVELNLRRAKILNASGELGQATQQLVEIAEQASVVRRPDLRCDALIALSNVDQKQGRAADARRRLSEAQRIASDIGDPRLQIRSGYESAELRADFDGEEAAAVADLRKSLGIAAGIDDRALRIEGHLRIGMLLANSGEFIPAQQELSTCSELAAETGSHRDEARATSMLGLVNYYLGDLAEAKRLCTQARGWLERTGDSYFQIQNLIALAVMSLSERDAEGADRWLAEALPPALDGGGWLVVEIYRYRVETLILQGRLDDAAELAGFARKGAPDEDLNALAAAAIADALVATATGAQRQSLQRFSEAVGLLAAQESPIQLAETRLAHARALRQFGHRDAAIAELRRAREIFEHAGAQALVKDVDRELLQLSE